VRKSNIQKATKITEKFKEAVFNLLQMITWQVCGVNKRLEVAIIYSELKITKNSTVKLMKKLLPRFTEVSKRNFDWSSCLKKLDRLSIFEELHIASVKKPKVITFYLQNFIKFKKILHTSLIEILVIILIAVCLQLGSTFKICL